MAGLATAELPDYLLSDLIPMEEEIDKWVNHDFWYTSQCIDHYDTGFNLDNVTTDPSRPLSANSVTANSSPMLDLSPRPTLPSNPGAEHVLKNLLIETGHNSTHNVIPALKVETGNQGTSMYMVPSGPTIFVPSPTIPIQSSGTDSNHVMSESLMSGSSCSSPVASVTPSDADSIYIQEGQMINFLRSDKGIEMFAKAHDMTKEDVINYLEAKKNGEDLYHNDHNTSPGDHDEKLDEDHHRRRRHRGTYSKSTCLQVIEFVKKGYSARAAAKKFGIPKSTVHNWLHEDVSTRPEKGHRKKDLFLERGDENEHDYHKNMTELDHSFSQTTIKDEPKFTNVTDNQVKIEQRPSVTSNPNSATITPQSALIKLLTTNAPMNTVKAEPEPDNFGFDEAEMQYLDFGVIDEMLQPDDWIGHEQWYKQQYHNHYNKDAANAKNRKSYGTYSNEHRMKATEYVKSGKTLSAASKEFNIPKSTIHTWLNEGNVPCELPPELENVVVEEIEQSKDGHNSPTLAVIKRKAEEVASPHMEKFRPSFAWCRDFMKRHYMDRSEEIDSKKICLEDVKKRASINDLVSVLGLDSNHASGVDNVSDCTTQAVGSPNPQSLLLSRVIEQNRNESTERVT